MKTTSSLILTTILPSLLLGAVIGTGAGYLMAKKGPITIATQVSDQKHAKDALLLNSASLPPGIAAPTTRSIKIPGTETTVSTTARAPEEGGAPSTYPTPPPDLLSKIGDKTWIQGVVQSKDTDEQTGDTTTVETLPDGATANREYRPDGSLKGESVTLADGTNINRNFFENGNVKIAFLKDTNGASTSILYDSTGVITQHTILYPDQTRIYHEYDDHGTILHTWRAFPDGHTEPYPPETQPE